MTTEGFDYKVFADELSNQAGELMPGNFQDFQKEYVINTIKNFSTLAGEAICNDPKLNFNIDQAMLVTQIIAEWSFHKSIDLIKAGILPDYWDGIMQKIAFTIFEVAKQSIIRNVPQDELLKVIEHHVKKSYQKAVEDLKERKLLDDESTNRALNQSNIDDMMTQMQEEKAAQEQETATPQQNEQQTAISKSNDNGKVLKLASVALLLKQLPQDKIETILNKFNENDAQTVIKYMQMNDLNKKIDENITVKCLQEIRTNLPQAKYVSPSKVLSMMNQIFEIVPKEKIDTIIFKERPGVKEFVNKANDGEYSEIPSKVASIIVQHIEESIS